MCCKDGKHELAGEPEAFSNEKIYYYDWDVLRTATTKELPVQLRPFFSDLGDLKVGDVAVFYGGWWPNNFEKMIKRKTPALVVRKEEHLRFGEHTYRFDVVAVIDRKLVEVKNVIGSKLQKVTLMDRCVKCGAWVNVLERIAQ
jgi:hypothetical protein